MINEVIEQIYKCEECGGPNPPTAIKCQYCGYWFKSPEEKEIIEYNKQIQDVIEETGDSIHSIGNAKDTLMFFIFFTIMIMIIVIMGGPNGSLLGNSTSTIGQEFHKAFMSLLQFAFVVFLLIVIVIIGALAKN